jgi:hypothetical protein
MITELKNKETVNTVYYWADFTKIFNGIIYDKAQSTKHKAQNGHSSNER